ncbi:MAG: glycosyltransferase [bacterium]
MSKNLIFILYDSIYNSVFESQVFQPLIKLIKNNTYQQITIISFEDFRLKNIQSPFHPKINFIFAKKLPFLGKTTLFYPQKQLIKILAKLEFQKIIARGPLAGFISLKAIQKLNLKKDLIIQARGLCAEEFRFSMKYQNKNLFKKLLQKFIYKSFKKVEKQTYSNKYEIFKIESVSDALKEYLVKNFNAKSDKIYIASNDIPEKINDSQIQIWKEEIRKQLKIPFNYKVYVYSGSMRPWQCAKESIEYFKNIHEKNPNTFLLILSKDKNEFEKETEKQKIPKNNFCVLSVKPNEVYKYLSGADYGLLFRDKDIINWVSRPTKMLEYQSINLKIIHNDTIEQLIQE